MFPGAPSSGSLTFPGLRYSHLTWVFPVGFFSQNPWILIPQSQLSPLEGLTSFMGFFVCVLPRKLLYFLWKKLHRAPRFREVGSDRIRSSCKHLIGIPKISCIWIKDLRTEPRCFICLLFFLFVSFLILNLLFFYYSNADTIFYASFRYNVFLVFFFKCQKYFNFK